MGAGVETTTGMPDGLKWSAVIVLMGAALTGFYYYPEQSLLLRVIGLLVVVGVSLAIVLQTEKGRVGWGFVRDARTEVRKVVWPTRKETVQTTLLVMAMVTLVAIFLWMLDGLLAWIVRMLLGTGG